MTCGERAFQAEDTHSKCKGPETGLCPPSSRSGVEARCSRVVLVSWARPPCEPGSHMRVWSRESDIIRFHCLGWHC